jgi:hypothetical protein
MNERYLEWDESATTQLIKLHIANKLGMVGENCERHDDSKN